MNNRLSGHSFLLDNQIDFENEDLMSMALVHPSYSQEQNGLGSNQRLEFLGDAVLDFVVAEYLYISYPEKPEGDLTQIRARVVCEKALAEVANALNLGSYIMLGRGEEMSGGRSRNSILADTVEAVIGAIYLDQGLNKAREFVLKYLEPLITETVAGVYQDYKSRLQEIVQARSKTNVHYKILEEKGPAHARHFIAAVYHQEMLLATGEGKSKKEAEQNAAEKAIGDLAWLDKLAR